MKDDSKIKMLKLMLNSIYGRKKVNNEKRN